MELKEMRRKYRNGSLDGLPKSFIKAMDEEMREMESQDAKMSAFIENIEIEKENVDYFVKDKWGIDDCYRWESEARKR